MRKQLMLPLTLLLLSVSQAGCVDAAREGITGGLSKGLENVISDAVEDLLAGILDS